MFTFKAGSARKRHWYSSVVFLLVLSSSVLWAEGGDSIIKAKSGTKKSGIAVLASTEREVSSGLKNLNDGGLFYRVYIVEKGDMIASIADKFDVTQDTLISFNGIRNSRSLQVGQLLKIPNMAGILYTPKEGDTLNSIAKDYDISAESIRQANELKDTVISKNRSLFLPDAHLTSMQLREVNGDLFRWPVKGYITSRYGKRIDPFSGLVAFHTGIDIAAPMGTPIRAAREGRVTFRGYTSVLGNHIIITHSGGYTTVYGHMSSFSVSMGQYVQMGQVIGAVGNTGYTTGPHCHFTVYRYGNLLNPRIVLN